MTPAPLPPDNPLWRFSLAVYAEPGVPSACLALQDRFGLDVNLALFRAWAGAARGRALTPPELAAAAREVEPWRERVVAPLRAVRRAVKAMPEVVDPPVAAFRRRVAAVELEAEQILQGRLFRWAESRWGPGDAGRRRHGGLARANLAVLLDRRGAARAEAAASADTLSEAAERLGGAGGAP